MTTTGPNEGPDEEGIVTELSIDHHLAFAHGPNEGPDEEGIVTEKEIQETPEHPFESE